MELQDNTKEYTLLSFSETGEYTMAVKTALQIAVFLEEIALDYEEPIKLFLEGDITSESFNFEGTKFVIIKGVPVVPVSRQVVTKLSVR